MPTIPANGKILVTGASGYLGSYITRDLLQYGYSVRGTVRTEAKGQYLARIFDKHFEYAVVPDVGLAGALDGSASDVVAIIHPATPFHYSVDEPEGFISGATQGNINVLKAAERSETVQRVIITSSVAAIMEFGAPDQPPRIFSEADWNDQSIEEVNEKGRDAWAVHKYFAAKITAERAAWDYWKDRRTTLRWDFVTILPTFICGPFFHESPTPERLNTSLADFYTTLIKGTKSEFELANIEFSWVDVRDAAHSHTLALQKEDAGGERFIVSAGEFVWQDWLDLAHRTDPDTEVVRGTPGAGDGHSFSMLYDTSKASNILGMTYHSMDDCLSGVLAEFYKRGWSNREKA